MPQGCRGDASGMSNLGGASLYTNQATNKTIGRVGVFMVDYWVVRGKSRPPCFLSSPRFPNPGNPRPSTLAAPEARRAVVYDAIRWPAPAASSQLLALPAPQLHRVPSHACRALAGPQLVGIGQWSIWHGPKARRFPRPATIQPVVIPAAIARAGLPFPSLPTDRA